MRQGDGSDLLGPGDPRNSDTGIIYVESTDSRQDILTAINTQELQGRKQIAIVLPDQGKAFRQPVDFDGLKSVRQKLTAQLVFIAPSGSGPAEFARQRRFAVYSSLETFKTALLNEGIPPANRRMKSSSDPTRKPGLFGLGSRKTRQGGGRVQNAPSPTPTSQAIPSRSPASFSPAASGPQETPPAPPVQNQPVPSTPRIDEMDTVEMDQSNQGNAGATAGAAAVGAAAGMLAARGLENDDDALAPPTPVPGGPVAPIAQGSATPTGPAVGPGRAELSSKQPPVGRKGPKPMVLPSGPTTPGKTPAVQAQGSAPRDTGKLTPQGSQASGSGKLPAVQGAPDPQNPPADKSGSSGTVAAVATGAALGAATMAASSGPRGGAPAATAASRGTTASTANSASVGQRPPSSVQQLRSSSGPPRRPWRRTFLWALILIVLSGLLAVGIIEARGGFSSIFGISANVTITPASKLEHDNYVLQALPNSTPNPNQRQIPARVLTATSTTESATAKATGSIEATSASGTLTFQNVGGTGITLGTTVLTGADGVQVKFYGPVFVPATGSASATATGYALTPGTAGNIPAFDLDGRCCAPNIFVKNTASFTGGQNAVLDSVIQQGDIDGAKQPLIRSLTQSTGSTLQKQVKSNERVVDGTFQCPATTSANHKAGDIAKTVTVQVSVKCTEEVYDFAAAQQMGISLLLAHARSDPTLTSQYKLDGHVVANVISATLVRVASEQVVVEVQAQGLWVYQFTSQMQQNIKQSLVRLTKTAALNKLQQNPGVSSAKISISSGDIMPSSADSITLTIVNLPGVQNINTPTVPTGIPTAVPTGATPGVTPSATLGGS